MGGGGRETLLEKLLIFPKASDASARRQRGAGDGLAEQKLFLLVVLFCFTASLGFMVSAGEDVSRFQNTAETQDQSPGSLSPTGNVRAGLSKLDEILDRC